MHLICSGFCASRQFCGATEGSNARQQTHHRAASHCYGSSLLRASTTQSRHTAVPQALGTIFRADFVHHVLDPRDPVVLLNVYARKPQRTSELYDIRSPWYGVEEHCRTADPRRQVLIEESGG